MSGIVGILNLDGAPVDPLLLQRMTEFLGYRGPDAQKIWIAGSVGFGHAALQTAGDSASAQPASLDGEVWITADARVDARAELTAKLASRGRQVPAGSSDAELILHAYHAWGQACVEHLLGDFAFAIWDGRRRRLFCARDHFGVKPFFYAHLGHGLIFSNTLDCLRLHPQISDELNDLAIADLLLFTWNREPGTTSFQDIQRLPAAHTLQYAQGTLRVGCYWTLPVDPPLRYNRSGEYVEQFHELLQAAVTDRLRTRRVGVLMSGGLDSTAMAATAKQLLSRQGEPYDLRAYTVVYQPLIPDDEGHYAGLAAETLGIPIQFFDATRCLPYERMELAELPKPEPGHEPLAVLQYDEFRLVAEHSRVALSGDGGDVFLHSQSWPYLAWLCRQRQFGRMIREVGGYVLTHGRIPPPLAGFRSRFRRLLGGDEKQREFPGWLNCDLEQRLGLRARWEEFNRPPPPRHPTRPLSYRILEGTFWPSIFESEDPGVTGVPLEVRSPFFDLRLARFLLALPVIPWCADKELLRVAMRGVLPEPVRRRRKSPLAADPLQEIVRRTGWSPEEHFVAAPGLERYVDLKNIPPIIGDESSDTIWLNLRPHSLNLWLQYGVPLRYKYVAGRNYEASVSDLRQKALSKSATGDLRQPR